MNKIGFGTYRVSHKSDVHKEALKTAIENGVSLIDTSSNYTDGESEILIGEVLKTVNTKPTIVTKAGYVQGQNLKALEELLETHPIKDEVCEFSDGLKHCIHPVFLNHQINQSLSRMGLEKLDVFLLHNPEYYLKTEGSTPKEFYNRIKKAFMFLEDQVKAGVISSYGISSNTFIDPVDDHTSTSLAEIIKIANDVATDHSFSYIQFPLNLMELGALERQFEGRHLIDLAKDNKIKTMVNRPFNALTESGLLRLAEYPEFAHLQDASHDEAFEKFIKPLDDKWEALKEADDEGLLELPLMKQIQEMWHTQPSEDAVDQVFFGHVFPFIAKVWGRDLTPDESGLFYEWYELAQQYSRKNMHVRASKFKTQAIQSGLLFEQDKNLSNMCLEKYATFGVDYTLVGMRTPKYVNDLKEYF